MSMAGDFGKRLLVFMGLLGLPMIAWADLGLPKAAFESDPWTLTDGIHLILGLCIFGMIAFFVPIIEGIVLDVISIKCGLVAPRSKEKKMDPNWFGFSLVANVITTIPGFWFYSESWSFLYVLTVAIESYICVMFLFFSNVQNVKQYVAMIIAVIVANGFSYVYLIGISKMDSLTSNIYLFGGVIVGITVGVLFVAVSTAKRVTKNDLIEVGNDE